MLMTAQARPSLTPSGRSSSARAARAAAVLSVLLCAAVCSGAEGGGASEAPAKSTLVRRLLARLDTEPLMVIYADDPRALPAKFSQTAFGAMLRDPTYTKGAAALRAMVNQAAGADIPALWPDFSKMLAGPAALAVVPARQTEPTEPALRLVLLVTTHTAETGEQLLALWPKPAPQSNTLFSALRLQPVPKPQLLATDALPAWVAAREWPQGEVCVRMWPRKLERALAPWFEEHEGEGLEFVTHALELINGQATEYLSLSITANGESFGEALQVEAAAERTALTRVAATLKPRPGPWDALAAATPGEHDLVLLGQLDPAALGPDLPFAAQAMERYLRGKKWARSKGRFEEAFAPQRFDFVLKRTEGSFAITARPALSGDLRLAMTAALTDVEPDMEALRAEVLKGLESVDAGFETLPDARRIGTVAPLGARFQGRGLFTSPIIGFSPGWAWLCSNAAAYQDLTAAFKTGRTLAADQAREKKALQAAGKAEEWRQDDAVRLQVDLERVLKLAYASWLLSGGDGPYIGTWKVPGDLLPQPQMFNSRLGVLRTGVSRQGNVLKAHALSTLPGASLILPSLIFEAADTIENSRRFCQAALEPEKARTGEDARATPSAPIVVDPEPGEDAARHGNGKKP